MSDTRPIGIFDSGIGGLTVVHEIFQRLPNESVVYFGDTARVPYGTKSPRVVEQFAKEDIYFLLRQDVKLVVAACHTVSSVALDGLVASMHLPILGVVDPGVKAALEATGNNRVGIIGTRATVHSGTYEAKFRAKNPDVKIFSKACPLFVPLAEEGWLESDVTRMTAEIYLEPIKEEGVDTLILGCTHYPLLKKVIRQVMGESVVIIDSAEETAKQVARRLQLIQMENAAGNPPSHAFYVSDIPHQFQEVGERFLGDRLGNVTRVDLDTVH
ncbi:glutamate racemase [bacterium]|nr:glutamate racemase [bacterium]